MANDWVYFICFSLLAVLVDNFYPPFHAVTKPLPMILLISLMWQNFSETTLCNVIFVGLIFGLGGDLFLLKGDIKNWFIAGLVSFLVGHILYIYGFLLMTDFTLVLPTSWIWTFFIFRYVSITLHTEYNFVYFPTCAQLTAI